MVGDESRLRKLVEQAVSGLERYTHRELDDLCPRLGLPPLPDEGSKSKRLDACLRDLDAEALPRVAQHILEAHLTVGAASTFALEDALWASRAETAIPGRIRRAVARAVDIDDLVFRADRFERMLEQLWHLDNDTMRAFTLVDRGLRVQIREHVYLNRDWSTEELFEQLGAFTAGHTRFARFLEALASADAVPDVPTQRRIVDALNSALREAGARLEESGERDGYPTFELRSARPGGNRRPKNLIFASSRKPDIRFLSTLDNDIEVLGSDEEVLVYDRPIGTDGICWRDLQQWWQESRAITDEGEAKRTLYHRLLSSMPTLDHSPQRHLYTVYHEAYGSRIPALPALLPEVWLHWDHKTVQQRGPEALLRFRMDFLLLLPQGRRVILEVDGSHHHKTPDAYEATVRGDRDAKLAGYDVFRFAARELTTADKARAVLQPFFAALFEAYDVVDAA